MIKTGGLLKLEKRIAHDLSIISYPVNGLSLIHI